MTTIIEEILTADKKHKEKVALLTEIAKYNSKRQNELMVKFQDLIKTEQNKGVKNLYLKALKIIKRK